MGTLKTLNILFILILCGNLWADKVSTDNIPDEVPPVPMPAPNYASPTTPASSGPCDIFADDPDPKMKQNCLTFTQDKDIPQDALAWTLNVYKQNTNGLVMDKCVLPPPDHYSDPGVTPATLKQGIKNKCQILINDVNEPSDIKKVPLSDCSKKNTLRGTRYFLNLCTGEKRVSYFNLGTGTFKNHFADVTNKHTTLLGAFLTSDKEFSYDPRECTKWRHRVCVAQGVEHSYDPIKAKFKKLEGQARVPAVALFGLQNTNLHSAIDDKYLHVSPYCSSFGCPSMNPDDYQIIDQMAANGPSLVVNYGPKDKMEDPCKCIAKGVAGCAN